LADRHTKPSSFAKVKPAPRLWLDIIRMTSVPRKRGQSRFGADLDRNGAPDGPSSRGILSEIIPSDGGGIVAVNCRDKPDATSG
jgi:hypothetical protein